VFCSSTSWRRRRRRRRRQTDRQTDRPSAIWSVPVRIRSLVAFPQTQRREAMDPNSLLPRHEIERYFSLENPRDKIAAECSRAPLDAEVRISPPPFWLLRKTLNLPILDPILNEIRVLNPQLRGESVLYSSIASRRYKSSTTMAKSLLKGFRYERTADLNGLHSSHDQG
jgi:hypothetical protein